MFPLYHSIKSMPILSSREKLPPFKKYNNLKVRIYNGKCPSTNFINSLFLPHKTSTKHFLQKYGDLEFLVSQKIWGKFTVFSNIVKENVRNSVLLILFQKGNIIIQYKVKLAFFHIFIFKKRISPAGKSVFCKLSRSSTMEFTLAFNFQALISY